MASVFLGAAIPASSGSLEALEVLVDPAVTSQVRWLQAAVPEDEVDAEAMQAAGADETAGVLPVSPVAAAGQEEAAAALRAEADAAAEVAAVVLTDAVAAAGSRMPPLSGIAQGVPVIRSAPRCSSRLGMQPLMHVRSH